MNLPTTNCGGQVLTEGEGNLTRCEVPWMEREVVPYKVAQIIRKVKRNRKKDFANKRYTLPQPEGNKPKAKK
ncbi:hypothetical protein RUM43_009766 [Polyplax serrata]|uniref:Uncharacterized protein n=1 Tax=Polyplax serrata TaxID=468196 RepID=A0AAN8S4G5_POLSC